MRVVSNYIYHAVFKEICGFLHAEMQHKLIHNKCDNIMYHLKYLILIARLLPWFYMFTLKYSKVQAT